jgi:hypothetical protein
LTFIFNMAGSPVREQAMASISSLGSPAHSNGKRRPHLPDVRVVTPLGFVALAGACLAMLAMLTTVVAARTGIWLITVFLGVYGVSLAIGHWIDIEAERERRSDGPRPH